jgi:hypothetical protein
MEVGDAEYERGYGGWVMMTKMGDDGRRCRGWKEM